MPKWLWILCKPPMIRANERESDHVPPLSDWKIISLSIFMWYTYHLLQNRGEERVRFCTILYVSSFAHLGQPQKCCRAGEGAWTTPCLRIDCLRIIQKPNCGWVVQPVSTIGSITSVARNRQIERVEPLKFFRPSSLWARVIVSTYYGCPTVLEHVSRGSSNTRRKHGLKLFRF